MAKWTRQHDRRLTELLAEGMSYSRIADCLNEEFSDMKFTRSSCIGRANRRGLFNTTRPNPSAHNNRYIAKNNRKEERRRSTLVRNSYIEGADEKIPSLKISFEDLKRDQCRFPTHEDPKRRHLFCGHKVAEGQPYCPYHFRIAYQQKASA